MKIRVFDTLNEAIMEVWLAKNECRRVTLARYDAKFVVKARPIYE